MNYITEILAFNDLLLSNPLSTGQIALWYALMYINNTCGWAEWFTAPNRTLELSTGLSRQAIVKNRNALKQIGLLDFRQNGTKATAYHLYTMSNSLQESLQGSLQESLQDGLQGSFRSSLPFNKLKETKRKEMKYPAAMRAREGDAAAGVLKAYETYIGLVTPNVTERIDGYLSDGVEADLLTALISYAAEQGKRTWQYVQGAIEGNLRDGVKTLAAYSRRRAERAQNQRAAKPNGVQKSKFNNYDDTNKAAYAGLEDKLLDRMLEGKS